MSVGNVVPFPNVIAQVIDFALLRAPIINVVVKTDLPSLEQTPGAISYRLRFALEASRSLERYRWPIR